MKINRRPIHTHRGVGCPGDPWAYAARIFRYYIVILIPILHFTYIKYIYIRIRGKR